MEYVKYMKKANFEKALNNLVGLLNGIRADLVITDTEIDEITNWVMLQSEHSSKSPFKEIISLIKEALTDGVLTSEEIEDILWACESYVHSSPYYDVLTAGIQTLHGYLHGILSDNKIVAEELVSLKGWLDDNSHLETVYPYDEVYSLIHAVMEDGIVDEDEEKMLKAVFSDFIDTTVSFNINAGDIEQIKKEMNIQGICALGPNIELRGNLFCFTGTSSKAKRSDIKKAVMARGGMFTENITQDTNYLIIGDNNNPCWAFSCYGRKIEKAVNYRKQGSNVVIAHEIDFWDALN